MFYFIFTLTRTVDLSCHLGQRDKFAYDVKDNLNKHKLKQMNQLNAS